HGNAQQQHRMPPARSDWKHDGYRHDDYRGAGPRHEYYRGARLPAEYRTRTYVVDDWRGHHLSAPPRGYHWVQAGSDYVLAAVATGVILDVLLSQ
ncbi:MAG: RcnB family protein, partial [Betaproteobacteria bacterium]